MVPWQVLVAVPIRPNLLGCCVLGAAVNLDEPHASLGQTTSQQTLAAEWPNLGVIDVVQLTSHLTLSAEVRDLWRTELQASRHFVCLNSGVELAVAAT